jgi:hypothetical protein
MPKIYKPFSDHESDEIWGRLYLKLVGKIARENSNLGTDFRLFLLGLQRVSNRGHSPFLVGEISRLLVRKEEKPFTTRNVNNQIKKLINSRVLAPTSNARCLVYPVELLSLKTDKKLVAMCPEHGTHSSWSLFNNDWVTDYLPTTKESVLSNSVVEVIVPENDFEFDIDSGTFSS